MLRLRIEHDYDCESPMQYDGSWKLYSFSSRHTAFRHPDSLDWGEIRKLMGRGLAHWLDYFEHGGSEWSISGEGMQDAWDTARYGGILVWEEPAENMGAKTVKGRTEDARSFLREYNRWANGECFWYSLDETDGEHGDECIDSCGGFIGHEYMRGEIVRALNGKTPDEVSGDAAWVWED